MEGKVYIWAFPGMGKSHLRTPGLQVLDADCEQFKYLFPSGAPSQLHQSDDWRGLVRNPAYPDNYLDFVTHASADAVLLNCHISLLDQLDKERLLLLYPAPSLKDDYLQRYKLRGDNLTYLFYMRDAFEDIIDAVCRSPYRKLKISQPNVFLQHLFNGGYLMNQFMTKPELTQLLEEAIQLGIYSPIASQPHSTPEALAQKVFEGEITLDFDRLKRAISSEKDRIAREAASNARRGGLSRDALAEKIMQGIINGALGIRYCEVAPYSHGYEVTFGSTKAPGSTLEFINRWECYTSDLFAVPQKVADAIGAGHQSNQIMGRKCGELDIHKMLEAIDEMEMRKIKSFIPEAKTDFVRVTDRNHYPYRSSVATVMDVHAGKGLDGIAQHHYHGDYSTITPVAQNSLVEALVCLKGFCLDCLHDLDVTPETRDGIVAYLKAHGTDISTPQLLDDWIQANPQKCGLTHNRERKCSLDTKIQAAGVKHSRGNGQSKSKDKEPEH